MFNIQPIVSAVANHKHDKNVKGREKNKGEKSDEWKAIGTHTLKDRISLYAKLSKYKLSSEL